MTECEAISRLERMIFILELLNAGQDDLSKSELEKYMEEKKNETSFGD